MIWNFQRCKQADNYAKLPEECFMYTWQLNIQQPFCEAFNDVSWTFSKIKRICPN